MKAKKSVPKVSSVQRKKLLTSLQDVAVHQAAGSSNRRNDQYRIVVDTSVLISAFFFGGSARDVLLHISNNQQMIISDYIIDEFLDFSKNTMPKTPQRMLRLMRQTLEKFSASYDQHDVEVRDINDSDIMQLAIEYDAAIITSDKDILEHAMGAKPPVMTIGDYEALIAE